MNKLVQTLRSRGHEPIVLEEKIVVLPFAGRILGLYPDGRRNVYWVHPAWGGEAGHAAGSADAELALQSWVNCGGDRTWIYPEIDVNIADLANMGASYHIPEAMDPAAYSARRLSASEVELATEMTLRFHRSRARLRLRLRKLVTALADPPSDLPAGVRFAGYTLTTTLTTESTLSGRTRAGIWNLIQVPGGGRIVIPTRGRATPRAFIGTPPVRAEEGRVECEVRAARSFKFCLRAGQSLGRALHVREDGAEATLVAREFAVHGEDRYWDAPADAPDEHGYVQSVYVDDGAFGGFGELEYISPALVAGGPNQVGDTSTVLAFAGPTPLIREIEAKLAPLPG